MLEPGKKHVVKWTAEGAVKCVFHRVFCDATGRRINAGDMLVSCQVHGLYRESRWYRGLYSTLISACSSLTESVFLSRAFFYVHGHPEEDCQQKLMGARRAGRGR